MLQTENVNMEDMEDWLRKCLLCSHAYTVKTEDMEIRCRLKKGCRFEYAEQTKELKKTEESGTKEKPETDWRNFIMQRMETVK